MRPLVFILVTLLATSSVDAAKKDGAGPKGPPPGKVAAAANASAKVAWAIADAPYRAVVMPSGPAKDPDAGFSIELPEFGYTMPKMEDLLLTDADGKPVPLYPLWRGEGQQMMLLAKGLQERQYYYLYFGGGKVRRGETWDPKVSLTLETRKMPSGTRLDTWSDVEKGWQRSAAETQGMAFVGNIFHGVNPFGDSLNFMSHYTGYLKTKGMKDVFLYTLSCDASFVFVNDKMVVEWPGVHPRHATQKTVHGANVKVSGDAVKIDYYQAKGSSDEPATMALGWRKDGKFNEIPSEAYLQPQPADIMRIENVDGRPVPLVRADASSYIGYAKQWLYEVTCDLRYGDFTGWTVDWSWDDGSTFSTSNTTGKNSLIKRICVGPGSAKVRVHLRKGTEEAWGVRRIDFTGGAIRQASINEPRDIERYVESMDKEDPAKLSLKTLHAYMILLRQCGSEQQTAKFANAYLDKSPDPSDELWAVAQLARLRAMIQTNPKQALVELQRMNSTGKQRYQSQFDLFELELLVFYLRDPAVIPRAQQIAAQNAGKMLGRLALVRVGDLFRLQGRIKEATEQYMAVQKRITDETAGKKLPAQDKAISMAVQDMITDGYRMEAEDKLQEWEANHPAAKIDTDFLLLRARVLMQFGRWREALAELDSLLQLQPDSPYQIDVNFYRASIMVQLGQKAEAFKIFDEIQKKYPKHELAAQASKLAEETKGAK